jgi:hypothetical protein
MKTRPLLAILGGGAVVVLVGVGLLRRGQRAPETSKGAAARSAVPEASHEPVASPSTLKTRVEARRARDAMREDILAALRKRDAGVTLPVAMAAAASTRTTSAGHTDDEPPHGSYEPSYIQEHFRADMFPLLKSCYEGALTRRPDLAGKLVMKFSIVGDPQVGGIIEQAEFADESDLKDSDMETCVRESLMTLTFDKPPVGGGLVTVTYPVAFSPGPDEHDAGTHRE